MTNSTERLGMAALTTHEVHLVSTGCSYPFLVEHRDLRIAAANLASSLGRPLQTTCSIDVLDDLVIEVISIWYRGPLRRCRLPDQKGRRGTRRGYLGRSIGVYPMRSSARSSVRRRTCRCHLDLVIGMSSTPIKGPSTSHTCEATSVCVSLRCESYSRKSRLSPAPTLD